MAKSVSILVEIKGTVYPHSINVRIEYIGLGKDGIDLSITKGVQYCRYSGERLTIVHKHGYLQDIEQGELVLFETNPRGQERLFWVGRTTNTAYWLMFETPQTIFEVIAWLSSQQDMLLAHNGELDFVDMIWIGKVNYRSERLAMNPGVCRTTE